MCTKFHLRISILTPLFNLVYLRRTDRQTDGQTDRRTGRSESKIGDLASPLETWFLPRGTFFVPRVPLGGPFSEVSWGTRGTPKWDPFWSPCGTWESLQKTFWVPVRPSKYLGDLVPFSSPLNKKTIPLFRLGFKTRYTVIQGSRYKSLWDQTYPMGPIQSLWDLNPDNIMRVRGLGHSHTQGPLLASRGLYEA